MTEFADRMLRPTPDHRNRLWTSADAARVFRVGVSSIKRWTDEGELESVRTPGGHRRYTALSLHRFASIRGLPMEGLPPMQLAVAEIPAPADVTLYQALANGDAAAVWRLVNPPVESLPKRATFLDRVVGDALREIGHRWERGDLGVDQEHRASNLIIDCIDRLRPAVVREGPLAILACPPDEWHDLPLRLVRLVFEWSGWRTELLGAALPWTALRHAIELWRPSIVGLSARSGDAFQQRAFDQLLEYCKERRTHVIVGGEWARGGSGAVDGYLRFRTLRGFERWLRAR